MHTALFDDATEVKLRAQFKGVPERALPELWTVATEPRYQPVRDWLEAVVAAVNDERSRRAMITNLRDWIKFPSLLAELATGDALQRAGYTVQHEPNIDGKTPDYLASNSSGRRMIVEVWRRNLPKNLIALNRRWADLTGRLEVIGVPVTLIVDRVDGAEHDEPAPPERPSAVAREIAKWVQSNNPDRDLEIGGLQFRIVGPSPSTHVELGLVQNGIAAGRSTVLDAIQNKVDAYRAIANSHELPLLVVLCGDQLNGVTQWLVDSVLTGNNPITMAIPEHGIAEVTFTTKLRATANPPTLDPALTAVAWLHLNDGPAAAVGTPWSNPAATRSLIDP